MSFEIQSVTHRWLTSIGVLNQQDKQNIKKSQNNTFIIDQELANKFQNGLKLAIIVQELYKNNGIPIPNSMNHLKTASHTAAMLYNWNILNDSLKKIGFQIDSQTKNMIINGDRDHLNMVLRNLQVFYEKGGNEQSTNKIEDSLQNEKINQISSKNKQNKQINQSNQMSRTNIQNNNGGIKDSMSLSYSQDQLFDNNKRQSMMKKQQQPNRDQNKIPQNMLSPQGDLLEYIVNELMVCLKLTKKQAVALLADNNKYLAHVLVKGVKGQFGQIDELMQKFYINIDYIIEKMISQNDMCFFFLQIIKPSLLSKSEEIAQWGCRILSKVANQLAQRQMLPLAYDWFVREAGGLSTTILALSRHPKLNQHVVAYILEFARYNVTQLFTIELKKITNNDNLNYVKFMLLIFQPLVESKLSAQQLLTSGAIDYWVEMSIKNSQSHFNNSKQLRLYSIEFLIKIWRAYPLHIQETLDQVNTIMINIKKGILQTSQIMRFSLLEIMFNLLDQFATKKNPYASILYKKLTFLFVQNHEQETMREFILSNLQEIFKKFGSIPVQIFLQPFIKQVKITENKSYFLQIFDMNFIKSAVQHRKLKVNTGIQLYDLLAKIKLNNNCYVEMANESIGILLDRFLEDELFFDYTVKLVKISLAMFYSTLKHKKQLDDQERIQAQKRAEIVNFIISLIERGNQELNEEIKNLVVHVKVQILNRLGITHNGIQRILTFFPDAEQAIEQAMQNAQQTSSNATNKTKSQFHLPKIESRNQIIRDRERQRDRDEVSSQQSNQTTNSKFSRVTNRSGKQFEMKEYSRYADQNQKNFMKQHNIQPTSVKKQADVKVRKSPIYSSVDKDSVDPKLQSQIAKLKQRKQQQQARKIREKEILQRKKQILKQKIQKQLEQRNIKQGVKGNEKDVEVKVIFEENELNEKLFQNTQQEQEVYFYKNVSLDDEEQRDGESIRLVLRKNLNFVKKIFTKYACAKVVKKDYFEEKTDMNQTDLLRLCKEKNLQKSKQPVLQIMKEVNNKNTNSIDIDTFPCFLENLCVFLYLKEKAPTHMPMGDFLRERILKKMTIGQNVRLDDEQDQQTKEWSEKVRYNPQIQLPENFKKVTERVYYPNKESSYPTKKAIKKQNFLTCFQVLNQMLYDIFKFNILQEEVRFKQELKVAPKKQVYLPPKPTVTKQEKQPDDGPKGLLLKQTQTVPLKKRDNSVAKIPVSKVSRSIQKQTPKRLRSSSKQKPKILNAAEKKKVQQEQNQRIKRQHQEELRKIRQLQVKKKLQKQKEQRQKEKQQKKQEEKKKKLEQEEKKKQQDQQQQLYKQKQKQKLQKYRKEQQEKQQAEKQRRKQQRQKEEQQKKQKISKLKVKQNQKRLQENQKVKKDRELSQQNKKKQKQDEQKKKEMLRKQVLKKLQNEKEKYEIQKTIKQLAKQVFNESSITQIFNQNKEQLKAMWAYGKQYNEYKLGMNPTQQALQSKGFMTLCQQFSICDVPTANKLLKTHQKQTGMSGFSYEQFQEILFSFNIKPILEKQMQNYDNAVKQSQKSMNKFMTKLNIPKDKYLLKDFFLNLKNQKSDNTKRRKLSTANEEVQITNSKGEKQNWQLQNDQEDNKNS